MILVYCIINLFIKQYKITKGRLCLLYIFQPFRRHKLFVFKKILYDIIIIDR